MFEFKIDEIMVLTFGMLGMFCCTERNIDILNCWLAIYCPFMKLVDVFAPTFILVLPILYWPMLSEPSL